MTNYPEHDKLMKVREESQIIGNFLDSCGYTLSYYSEQYDEFVPTNRIIEEVLAEFFGINLDILNEEKMEMLEQMREADARTATPPCSLWVRSTPRPAGRTGTAS